jgi:hypothetical protein
MAAKPKPKVIQIAISSPGPGGDGEGEWLPVLYALREDGSIWRRVLRGSDPYLPPERWDRIPTP